MPKPSGSSGIFRVAFGHDGTVVAGFEGIAFPAEKADLELKIATAFIDSMNSRMAESGETFFLGNPRQNVENDFDFTVACRDREADLELMEVAILRGPYETAPQRYKPYEFAQAVISEILKKSGHYQRSGPTRELFLLLYITHWAFLPTEATLHCLRYWLARQSHVFSAIFFFHFSSAEQGDGRWIYPYPPELIGSFDPETVRDNVGINFDPQKFVPIIG